MEAARLQDLWISGLGSRLGTRVIENYGERFVYAMCWQKMVRQLLLFLKQWLHAMAMN